MDLVGYGVTFEYSGHGMLSGKVLSSRVKYGGTLQHTVELFDPVQFKWRTDQTKVVLIDHLKIISITGHKL